MPLSAQSILINLKVVNIQTYRFQLLFTLGKTELMNSICVCLSGLNCVQQSELSLFGHYFLSLSLWYNTSHYQVFYVAKISIFKKYFHFMSIIIESHRLSRAHNDTTSAASMIIKSKRMRVHASLWEARLARLLRLQIKTHNTQLCYGSTANVWNIKM